MTRLIAKLEVEACDGKFYVKLNGRRMQSVGDLEKYSDALADAIWVKKTLERLGLHVVLKE